MQITQTEKTTKTELAERWDALVDEGFKDNGLAVQIFHQAEEIIATLTQQLADEKAKREEVEKERQNIREQEAAWAKVTAKCNHLPRLVIDTEDGQKCCECWAIEERDRADTYEKTEPIKKAEHAYVTGIIHAAHAALGLPVDSTFGQIVEPIRQLKSNLARAIAERDEARKETERCDNAAILLANEREQLRAEVARLKTENKVLGENFDRRTSNA